MIAFLRFLNLLEPGKRIVSISKTAMWISVLLVPTVVIAQIAGAPIDATATIGVLVSLFGATGNYAWRRYVAWRSGYRGGDMGAVPVDPPHHEEG